MNKLIPLVAFSILLLIPAGAQNAFADVEEEFDTSGTFGTPTSSISFLESGVTMTATGLANGLPVDVILTPTGLGVTFEGDNTVNIDDSGPDETLVLTFDQEVRILEVVFTEVGEDSANDDYTLFIDGVEITTRAIADASGIFVDDLFFVLDEETRTGTEFGFSTGTTSFDDFRISGIIVEILENEQNSQVIGGEIIPIETTSLLLSGMQTNLSWIIPAVVIAAGASAFLVRRRV